MELKDNTIIVVLGASGDLAKKKTVSIWATSQAATSLTRNSTQRYLVS
jgi:glucose-6-phosphate 1-dehydrogenase